MSGKDLKEKLRAEGVNLSELSEMMGYKTDQNLHSVLGAADVKSSVIERISLALGKPIGWLYGEGTVAQANEHSVAMTGGSYNGLPEGVLDMMRKKDEQIDRLLAIIEKLSSR